jgi:hypothetical protein
LCPDAGIIPLCTSRNCTRLAATPFLRGRNAQFGVKRLGNFVIASNTAVGDFPKGLIFLSGILLKIAETTA